MHWLFDPPAQVLEDFRHGASLEYSNDKWVAFGWPQRIAQQCEVTAGLLKQSRGLFQEEVGNFIAQHLRNEVSQPVLLSKLA